MNDRRVSSVPLVRTASEFTQVDRIMNSAVAIANDDLYVVWELWQLHNEQRIRAGLPPFKLDGRLWRVANRFAKELASRGVLTHDRADGTPFYDEIDASVGRQVACSENAAMGQTSDRQAIVDWMLSDGHRANILGPYDTWGGAMAVGTNGAQYWVCDFAKLD